MLNAFHVTGDMIQMSGIAMILHRLLIVGNAQGISRKTQELYLLVYITRYMDTDLFSASSSRTLYVATVRFFCTVSTAVALLLLSRHGCSNAYKTYRSDQDSFPHFKFLMLPCMAITLLRYWDCLDDLMHGRENPWKEPLDALWAFSIILESVATIPQVLVYQQYSRDGETNRQSMSGLLAGGRFAFSMGLYKFFSILNWIFRAYTQPAKKHTLWVLYICGVVQVAIGCGGYLYLWSPHQRVDRNDAASLLPLVDITK